MDERFCKNLKIARKLSGYTQKQIAARLKVVESCYENWEQGRTEPNIAMLRQLSVILEVSVEDLVNG